MRLKWPVVGLSSSGIGVPLTVRTAVSIVPAGDVIVPATVISWLTVVAARGG